MDDCYPRESRGKIGGLPAPLRRKDVVFLINGNPALVIACKNVNKYEAIALGVDQIRRYHSETPEMFVSQQLFTAPDAIGFS